MITLGISDILTSTGPWALLPPGPVCVYTDNDGVHAPHDWRWHPGSELLLVTGVLEPSSEVLPALGLLLHSVRVLPADASALVEAPPADVILVDARRDLANAKSICRLLHTTGLDCPMLAIVTEGGLAAISADWNVDDVILNTAGPAEVEARLRLATGGRGRARRGRRARRDQVRRPGHRRGHLLGAAARPGARPHLQGVRAAEVPRAAPRPGIHPGAPAAGGVVLRLLRWHQDGGRPRPP